MNHTKPASFEWIWKFVKPIIHWGRIQIVQRLRDRPGVMWSLFMAVWGLAAWAAGAAYCANTPQAPLDDVLMEGAFTAIQMIVANAQIVDTTNSYFYAFQRLGQFALPFLGLLGLIDAASRLGEGHEEVKRKALLESRDIHIYFLGYGNFAHRLAEKYLEIAPADKGDLNIVAVDTNTERLAMANNRIMAIHADAQDDSLLSALNLKSTTTIYLDVGSDEANYRISRKLVKLSSQESATKLKIFVHIGNSNYEKAIDALNSKSFELRCISLGATASRGLLGRHPPARTRDIKQLPVQILLAGYGWMGDSLLREIIKTCHYQDHRPPHITIVHEEADRIQKEIEQEYPYLRQEGLETDIGFSKTFPVAKLRYIKAKPECLTTSELKRLEIIHMYKAAPHPVDMAYVITDDDILNNVIAERLDQLKKMSGDTFKVVKCANQTPDSTDTAGDDLFDTTHEVIEQIDSVESYPGKHLDDIGKEIHAHYKKEFDEKLKDRLWEQAEAWERNSSNASADHLWLKIWAYVKHVEGLGKPKDWEYWEPKRTDVKALVEKLVAFPPKGFGEMEHRRFCAERLVAGWQYWPHTPPGGAEKKEIRALRLNETLKPFGELDETTQGNTNNSFTDGVKALQEWCCSRKD